MESITLPICLPAFPVHFPEITPLLCSLINCTLPSFRLFFSPLTSSRLWQNPVISVSRDLLVIPLLSILQHLLCHRDHKQHNITLQAMHLFVNYFVLPHHPLPCFLPLLWILLSSLRGNIFFCLLAK